MQTAVPEVMDISRETKETIAEYGATPGGASFANNCLLARRLIEQDVRFVQLFDWGWDFHGTDAGSGLTDGLTKKCASMDKPVAALFSDLKKRGCSTTRWSSGAASSAGRRSARAGRPRATILGRDHYPDCFCAWMAGAGVKHGFTHGATDELGFSVAENEVHVHDLQATILHLLGMNHERLTFRFQGRDFRLTDVHGHVVKELLA